MQSSQRTVRQVKKHQRHHNLRPKSTTTTTQQNFWLTNYGIQRSQGNGKARESLVQGLEVLKLLAKMYGVSNGSVPQQQQQMQQYQQQEQYNMYGMHENSTIPGATSTTSSPTMLQQPHHDLYASNGGNLISSLRTHSSKFPIERELILTTDKNGSKIPLKQYPRQIPTTPIAFQRSSSANGNGVIQQFLPKSSSAIAPDHPTPKQFQAWNAQEKGQSSALTGAIPRTPSRMPEDVTALAEREMGSKDGKESKNAVTKTYHTLKDLISSKFKKDSSEMTQEELNNVTIQQQASMGYQGEDMASPYYALMQQQQMIQQQQSWHNQNSQNSQNMAQNPQMWNGRPVQQPPQPPQHAVEMNGQQQLNYSHMLATRASIHQQRTLSQPQLNMPYKEVDDRRGSLANIDVTDSDEGGFANKWRPTTQQRTIHSETPAQQILHLQQQNYLKRSSIAQQNSQSQQVLNGHYHNQPPPIPTTSYSHQQQKAIPDGLYSSQKVDLSKNPENLPQNSANTNAQEWNGLIRSNQEKLRASFQQEQPQLNQKGEKQVPPTVPAKPAQHQSKKAPNYEPPPKPDMKKGDQSTPIPTTSSGDQNGNKQIPGSAASSDYDKSGNHSSNVDSGRGSAAYSSGRKAAMDTSPDQSDTPVPQSRPKSNDSEWIDIVDAELRHILEPGLQNLSIRPESTISGSLSSISPPLPPLSPDGSLLCTNTTSNKTSSNTITNKISTSKMGSQNSKKPEYGTDSYNRPGKNKFIGPSRGLPGSILQKRSEQSRPPISKKQEQSLIKKHLFGLDDMTSTTTRSLDLDSLLGGPWGGGQSVSDSETDTQGLRHIKSQLEGLENMYSEVLKMLGARPNGGGRGGLNEGLLRNTRRRQGSLSSLPSSSVSGRPIRDRRRNEERRKVRDIKGINKRFQRLESHVVTLARSVAHLSSEMRSQHLVTQELEGLRQDLTNFRMQSQYNYTNKNDMGHDVLDGPNLTNPKRVKKLTKFFGEDPPLMRLFLKKLGYEKYAPLFETERVGMIELPYLGEERLQKLGVPLGPRLRILQEAQISLCKDKTLCIV